LVHYYDVGSLAKRSSNQAIQRTPTRRSRQIQSD
jgi:hypothetical protein